MIELVRCGLAALILCIGVLGAPPVQAAPDCPDILKKAERLILVQSPSFRSATARVQFYERGKEDGWQAVGSSEPAVLGRSGMGWSWAFEHLAKAGEPVKQEGDGRTPAGFFKVGRAFGVSDGPRPNYTRLRKGEHFCVDDPAALQYNQVVPRSEAGSGTSGEDMGTIGLYREGLFLDYPTSRKRQGGSCIFVHVWRSSGKATSGCVALAEPEVRHMQSWSSERPTVIALLTKTAWNRLRACFPGL